MPFDIWTLYNETRKYYALIPPPAFLLTLFIDAPFGRFSWKSGGLLGLFQVDGIKSWIVMELVSPMTFIYALLQAPFTSSASSGALKLFSKIGGAQRIMTDQFPLFPSLSALSMLSSKQKVLASLFLIHYANRAIISPLRTPGRSPSNIAVVICAIVFNLVNGSLMGSYISSDECQSFLQFTSSLRFWFGIALWTAGFIGNIVHDEILLNIRRRHQSAAAKKSDKEDKKEMHYAIPHGLLYEFVSYPNYFCEWVEWIGFALAASPVPPFLSSRSSRLLSPFTQHSELASSFSGGLLDILQAYTQASPPWLFVFAEIFTMASRAWRGHQWYKSKFPEYPTRRTAVVPFLL
ncbi:hypothetical protein SCHPADRAFT_925704 [Schizopora paradoxa]|uniref:3-oxo-5-alpha-steroid 4-dehydrogenase C-terminal domain-containing protein n=1 Tax=Schizopora paradoxa TaxID=27342 RepID=A0A0H2SKR5_9AGAM|nr:hypothetical protein SCHPADRAFT_925704 [Schizopora paradoxa]